MASLLLPLLLAVVNGFNAGVALVAGSPFSAAVAVFIGLVSIIFAIKLK